MSRGSRVVLGLAVLWLGASGASMLGLGVLTPAVGAQELPPRCGPLGRPNRRGRFIARADLARPDSALDGDDLLALVNRSPEGALPPDYAPSDLVDLAQPESRRPRRAHQCRPPGAQCLRREAAEAFRALEAAMQQAGLRPYVASAFRAYPVQCATFLGWSARERGGFCAATTASALPGHSQHQLGTTLDLFTRDWMDGGDKFRAGFGCTAGGLWIREHAAEHGFVLPYPLHPDYRQDGSECAAHEGAEERIDPRTGYRYEPWHLRYVGREPARRYHDAWRASGPGTPREITLEQWLRAERGLVDPVGAPVCDGCNCDRCATFSQDGLGPCDAPALVLDPAGRPLPSGEPPRLLEAALSRSGDMVVLEARVVVAPNTLTQPPVVTPVSGASFSRGLREAALPGRAPRPYPALPDAWRLAIGFGDGPSWPWRMALVGLDRDATVNGVNTRFPAPPGEVGMRISMRGVSPGTLLRVGIASDTGVRSVRRLRAP